MEKKYGELAIEQAQLEVWENPSKERDYLIEITFPEFSCLCPRSGYPDYATIKIRYIPDQYNSRTKVSKALAKQVQKQIYIPRAGYQRDLPSPLRNPKAQVFGGDRRFQPKGKCAYCHQGEERRELLSVSFRTFKTR
jgi:Enzyme related to GTP cyclohydrolase I